MYLTESMSISKLGWNSVSVCTSHSPSRIWERSRVDLSFSLKLSLPCIDIMRGIQYNQRHNENKAHPQFLRSVLVDAMCSS